MVAYRTFEKALDAHYQTTRILESVFNGQAFFTMEDCYKPDESFKTWLQSQNASVHRGDERFITLQSLYNDYQNALNTLFRLHNKDSIDQARSFYEREFKEQSLKLTAALLRWINLLTKEEIRRYETL